MGDEIGEYYGGGVIKGDTRSLDYSSSTEGGPWTK